MTANRPTTGTLAAHRQRLSGLLALFAAVLPLPSPGEELSQSPAPTEPGISIVFSALQREPDESFMEESSGWMLQFRSPEEYLSVGLEFISQPRIRHEFTYQVPYGTLHERRSYALHSFGMVLHLSPCPGCFLSPYVGYAAAAGFIKEHMPDPRYFEGAGDYTHIWIGGPVVGLTLLPKAPFSLFVEAREQSLLSGDLTRERTVSIDMLGNQVVAEDKVTLDARVALIGLRINFYEVAMISRLYAVVLMLAATSTLTGCEEEERQEESSRIKPLAPLVSGLESIKLVSPANGSGFTVFDGSTEPLTFRYEADRPFFGALFLFREMPTATDGALADIAESCIGGVTDMAPSHNWDPWGATLHPQTENSELYRCYGADPMEPLSLEEKLALTEEDFVPGSTIYWAVLGYSAHYRLTHSSPVYRLVIE